MRLAFVLLFALPVIIFGKPMDKEEPSNSNGEDEMEKTNDLSDSKGNDEEFNEELCVAGTVRATEMACTCASEMCRNVQAKCNHCWCRSKVTGKMIGGKCY